MQAVLSSVSVSESISTDTAAEDHRQNEPRMVVTRSASPTTVTGAVAHNTASQSEHSRVERYPALADTTHTHVAERGGRKRGSESIVMDNRVPAVLTSGLRVMTENVHVSSVN